MPIYVPGKLILRQTYIGTDDPDAQAYIAAVEAADEAASPGIGPLETATKVAIHSFVKGCKADGIWSAIKASCILAGARTLAGALTPLAGTAPTNFNFVAGDYDRKTGLVGNGSTKYLNSNRANNADPQDNNHNACWVSSQGTGTLMASGTGSQGRNFMDETSTTARISNRTFTTLYSPNIRPVNNSLIGTSRSTNSSFNVRLNNSTVPVDAVSDLPDSINIFVFARFNTGTGGVDGRSTHRLAFYSIGESLDLALLDAGVTALINAIGAAIP